MNHTQQGILTLIRSAISRQSLSLPENFCLEEAKELIFAHQITGLCYEGAVLCGIPKSDPIMTELFQKYCRALLRSNGQMKALAQLYEAFEKEGIDYLPVKGCVLKPLYPNPAMRIMGDADVLIRVEQYERIKPIMLQLGYTEGAETGHELIWDLPCLHLELHKQLFANIHSDLSGGFQDVWRQASLRSGHCYRLLPEQEYLHLISHYAKHYRKGGIGVRQLVDIWLFRQHFPDLDKAMIRTSLEQMQLWTFYKNTLHLLKTWFEDAPQTDISGLMTNYIFESGSWGKMETYLASHTLMKARQTGSIQQARISFLRESVFPSANILSLRYPFLKKAPWLLPVMWPVRWVSALLFRRQNIKRTAAGFNAENIQSFEQSLAYVGLDFHV